MANEKPLISVIVPVYKVEAYLDRCVESIVNQTYQNLEIILVDDGSPDNCPALCDKWAEKDSRIKVVHKENGGLSSARNAGIAVCFGDFVGFVDSDDWIESDMYEYLFNLLKNTDADYSAIEMEITKEFKNIDNQPNEKIETLSSEELFKVFFRVSTKEIKYCVCDKLFRSRVVKNVKFFEGIRFEDILYNFEALKICNKAVYSNQIKYHWFFNTEGITNNAMRSADMQMLEVWEKIESYCKSNYPQYYYYAQMCRKRANMALLGKYVKYGVSDNYSEWEDDKNCLVKALRNSFFELMKWNLPISRKILLLGISVSVDVCRKVYCRIR